ncbi:MAG: hypothetical protein ACRC1P_09735 [Cellulosilyticaceae bacterium]
MYNKDTLKVGMVVEVLGRYDFKSSIVRIIELSDGLNFTHETLGMPKIVSCHKYSDIVKVIGA